MTSSQTSRQRLFLVSGVLSVALGLGTGHPELVAVGAPCLLLVAIGALVETTPAFTLDATLSRRRALETEHIELQLTVDTPVPLGRSEIMVPMPEGLVVEGARMDDQVLALEADVVQVLVPAGSSTIRIDIECRHWGTYRLEAVELRVRSFSGTRAYTAALGHSPGLKVFPPVAELRRLLEPVETRLGFGDLVSRARGNGFEYADLRPYVPGDDPRAINWRVTARASEPWVTERHPERNADVVFMIDTFAEARRGVDQTLDLAVRAVTALVEAHGRRLDRVGLLAFGEPVRWLQPGMGDRHRYRLLDTLMESRVVWQQYWRGLGAVPRRSLPANALVIGLSPLLDMRAIRAFADVRGRGFDLAILELEPDEYLPPAGPGTEDVARRIWQLDRDRIRHRFERQGVVVTPWARNDALPVAITRAGAFRRRLLRARV